MPGVFQMQTETMSTTSAFLADQADDLERELADINRRWRDLAAMWTGRAASAYEPAWEEWHDGAKTVVAILQEHSDLLQRAVAMAVADEQQRAVWPGGFTGRGTRAMSRYTVELGELGHFADRLERFATRAQEVESAIDRQIAELHTTWVGVGADAQRQYHEVWLRAAREMREAVAELRANAIVAHGNYIGAGELNSSIWR